MVDRHRRGHWLTSRIRILKVILLVVGIFLLGAWFGAGTADGQPQAGAAEMPAADGGLVLLKSDTDSVIVELQTPSHQTEEMSVDGVVYQVLDVLGYGRTDDEGRPQLPLKGTMLGIPPGAELTLNVLEADGQIVAGHHNIYPAPHLVVERDLEGNVTYRGLEFVKDDSVYSSNTFYPGSIAEIGSSGFIRDQRVVQLRFFPFRYNPASGELRHYRRIRVELSFVYPGGGAVLAASAERTDPFNQVLEKSLLNYDSAATWRARPSASLAGAMASVQPEAGYKVLVDRDGIYSLTYTDTWDAGIDPGTVDLNTVKLYNQGHEVPIHVVDWDGEGDFDPQDNVLFYGQQMTSPYTDTNAYILTWGGSPGLRMQERDGTLGAGVIPTYFQTTGRWEEDLWYDSLTPIPATIPSEEPIDHWFGGYLYPPVLSIESYPIELPNLALSSPPYSSTVRGYLHGRTYDDGVDPDHHTRVYVNGRKIDDATWDGQVEYQFQIDVPQSYLLEGTNIISVECPGIPGVRELVYNHWFEIDYRRTYTVENDSLLFDGDEAGTWWYEVGPFSTADVEVFDITDPLSATRIVSTTVVASDSHSLKFEDTIGAEHHYLGLTSEQYRRPLDIVEYALAGLGENPEGADYIIITHPDFYTDVLALRDHREDQGLRTAVVDVEDIYDEFSYGIFDPHAIRDFLSVAYDNWTPPAPSYVLLVGDGNFDFKDHFGRGEPNYIPPYLVYADKWIGETDADNRFVCVSGDDILPDMHLGRLPAQTAAEARAMVNKVLDYELSLPEGDWQNQMLFVADDPDTAGDFRFYSDDIADNHVPWRYAPEKVYYKVPPYVTSQDVTNAIFEAFETGRLIINYVGHGHPSGWGAEEFLAVADVEFLPPSQRMPMMLPMACLEGYFIQPSPPDADYSSLGESLVRADGRGAVASWSPTSDGLASGHHYLHEGFSDALFELGVHQIGPAALLGKLNLYENAGGFHRELIDTYIIFGDPAMALPVKHYLFLPLAFRQY